jgi:homocysteine S-methyltransferase
MDFHRPRMEVLANTELDLFAFETIPSMLEAEALLEVLPEFPDVFAWLSFSCKDGLHVSHGETFAECARLAEGSDQVVAVGLNCTAPEYVSSLLGSVKGLKTPLVVYPNSGETWNPDGNHWMGEQCQAMPVADWYDRGARLIGGCCRTTTGDISLIRAELIRHIGKKENHDRAV